MVELAFEPSAGAPIAEVGEGFGREGGGGLVRVVEEVLEQGTGELTGAAEAGGRGRAGLLLLEAAPEHLEGDRLEGEPIVTGGRRRGSNLVLGKQRSGLAELGGAAGEPQACSEGEGGGQGGQERWGHGVDDLGEGRSLPFDRQPPNIVGLPQGDVIRNDA